MKRHRRLGDDDRIVWDKVARTVKPLRPTLTSPRAEPVAMVPETPAAADRSKPFLPPYVPGADAPRRPASGGQRMERTELDRLVRGRTDIEARIDLHGMTQGEAHALLLRFLRSAHAQGLRNVLVITGKGSALGSDGVLRRVVPAWLATPPFSGFVSGHAEAGRRHGGAGALYVRIRRADRTIAP